MMKLVRWLCVWATLALAPFAPAMAQLRVVVDGENFQPMPMAAPDFSGATPEAARVAAQISEVVRADLAGSGLFRLLDKALFIERNLDIAVDPRFPDWRSINAEALVVGRTLIQPNGETVTQFRVYDVFRGKQIYSQQYTVPTADNWRRVAHKIADDVYAQLTGEGGYFDSRIVFVAESGPRIDRKKRLAIMDQDGANAEFLTSGANSVLTPRFDPSSQKIIYSAYVPDARNPAITRLRVYLFDIETGRQEVLSTIERDLYFAARFSPDGKSVVMSREERGNTDIYVIDLARRGETRLTREASVETSPSFAPDGKRLVFTSDRSGGPQIYVMNLDGSAMTCPRGGSDTACRISFGDGEYQTPVWSPRGDWIAFTRRKGGKFYIGVVRPDGTGERLLTESYLDEGPTWSPNGRVIAFFRETGPGAGPKLWSIDLTGRNLKRIPTPGEASDPAWSPVL